MSLSTSSFCRSAFARRAVWFGLILCLAASSHAQRQDLRHPVDQSDFWISSLNPAVMPFRHSEVAAGTEILHMGFVPGHTLGLREHRLRLSFPYWLPQDLAVGVDLRAFNAQLYSELAAHLLLARRLFPPLAVGLRVGVETRSFDQSEFRLVDLNDPVLQAASLGRTTPNLGVSLYWQAGAWSVGASVDHLNGANLGLATKVPQPRHFTAGISYQLGQYAPSLVWNQEGNRQNLGFSLAARVNQLAALRLSVERSGPVRLESQFHLSRDATLSYGVNLPLGQLAEVSRGTHALAYGHILGREPDIGAPLLTLSANQMNILLERLTRVAEAGVALGELAKLPSLSQEYLDPQQQLGNLVVVPLVGVAQQVPSEHVPGAYRFLSRHVADALQEDPSRGVVIRVASGNADEARRFERILREESPAIPGQLLLGYQQGGTAVTLREFVPGRATRVDKTPVLSCEQVVIAITVPSRRRLVKEWRLAIRSGSQEPVRTFSGAGTLPTEIIWDWRNADGRVVAPGAYQVRLELLSRQNKRYEANADLEVTLTRREITLRLTSGSPPAPQSARIDARKEQRK